MAARVAAGVRSGRRRGSCTPLSASAPRRDGGVWICRAPGDSRFGSIGRVVPAMLDAMPKTDDLLVQLEQLHQAAVQARKGGDFNAAMEHNEAALRILPANGTLTSAAHSEWLQRFVEERGRISDTAARCRIAAEREKAQASEEQHWVDRNRWSAQRVPRAHRQARLLLIGTTVACCLAVALVEVFVRLATSRAHQAARLEVSRAQLPAYVVSRSAGGPRSQRPTRSLRGGSGAAEAAQDMPPRSAVIDDVQERSQLPVQLLSVFGFCERGLAQDRRAQGHHGKEPAAAVLR